MMDNALVSIPRFLFSSIAPNDEQLAKPGRDQSRL